MSKFSLHSEYPPLGMLAPAADAVGRVSRYRSLRNSVDKLAVVCRVNQGNAVPVTFTVLQSIDINGNGSKVIPVASAYYNTSVLASDTLISQGIVAGTFVTDAGIADKILIFEIEIAELDVNNGFNHIAVQTSASNAANITSAVLHYKPRFALDTPYSSLV